MNWKFLSVIQLLTLAICAEQWITCGGHTVIFPVATFTHMKQGVIKISGDTVEDVTRSSSPTLVIRAITNYLVKWRVVFVNIVTERKFYIIAQLWVEEIRQIFTTVQIEVLNMDTEVDFVYTSGYGDDDEDNLKIATIILLDSATICTDFSNIVFNAFGKKYVTGKVIIVGKCASKVFRRYSSDIRRQVVIITAPINDWLHGYVPFKNIGLYSLQRKHYTQYVAIPFGRVNPDGTISNVVKPHQYYGYMKGKDIFVAYSENQKLITSCQNNTVSKFGGGYIESLQGFLEFRICCQRRVNYGFFSENNTDDNIREPDVYLMASVLQHSLSHHLYPQFFMDYVAFIVRNEDEQISLMDLITLMCSTIWICLSLCVILINCSFLLIYYQNPRLQQSIKVRKKAMSKVINIISLHGLTFFQSEWQQGPTVSSKWILCAYNILFLIFSAIYTTLFTQKIFSLEKLAPFNVQNIPNSTFIFSEQHDFVGFLISAYCPIKVERGHFGCILYFDVHQQVDSVHIVFEKLKNGNWTAAIEITAIALKEMKHHPEIGIVRDAMMKYPFSFISPMNFEFLDIFHAITLKMREIGAIKRLINLHLDFKFVSEPVLNPVMFALIWYLLVILGVGVVISLIISIMELFISSLDSNTKSFN